MWRRFGGFVALLASLLAARPASAQAVPQGSVPIAVYPSTPALRFELQLPDSRRPVALCQGACTAYLPPGRYRLFVHPSHDTRAGGRTVKIEGPSMVELTPRSEASYQTGLTLGIVGSALVLVSMVTLVSGAMRNNDGDFDNDSDGDLLGLSLIGLLTGAVLTPIGWVSFGRSLRPGAKVQPLR
jgi:hypothetical protein